MKNLHQKIAERLVSLRESQPALAAELAKLRKKEEFVSETRSLTPLLKKTSGGLESAGGNFALETIVLRTGRPVLTIARNQANLIFSDPKSKFWGEKLKAA